MRVYFVHHYQTKGDTHYDQFVGYYFSKVEAVESGKFLWRHRGHDRSSLYYEVYVSYADFTIEQIEAIKEEHTYGEPPSVNWDGLYLALLGETCSLGYEVCKFQPLIPRHVDYWSAETFSSCDPRPSNIEDLCEEANHLIDNEAHDFETYAQLEEFRAELWQEFLDTGRVGVFEAEYEEE